MAQSLPLIGRDREMRCFAALLDRLGPDRPAVVLVDGPADSGRARLLHEFAAQARRRNLTFTTGPDRIVLGPVTETAEVHRLRLAPLAADDVRRLITAMLPRMRPGDRLLDLARVAAGRPGAVVRLIAALRAEGLLRISDGIVVPVPARLPESTRARLADRLAGLSPAGRHLLQAATALPSPFVPARLTGLLGGTVVTLLPAIEEALDSGLIVAAGDTLAFSHELVRPIVEASMPRPVLTALHRERTARTRPPSAHRAPRPFLDHDVDLGVLSGREREIAELVAQALTNQQIAARVGRSPHTVNYHLRQIFRKLGVVSRVELVALLRRRPHLGEYPLPG
ncbi:LuxR C-terminal-related transcriptional regulator [Actinoplanes sp. NBC_00393]|uniref:helix-turn-helix domain-containing protein n=1 Tax=Actinoplanes sp. NBC_00393 TaxID=2975953 RepID=UPI002E1EF256